MIATLISQSSSTKQFIYPKAVELGTAWTGYPRYSHKTLPDMFSVLKLLQEGYFVFSRESPIDIKTQNVINE